MGENLSLYEGTQMTSVVNISTIFFLNSLRTGLESSKAVGVIRKSTELL